MKRLSEYTNARVDLGSAGGALPTGPLLELRLAHARARDAVHSPFDALGLAHELAGFGWPSLVVNTGAANRDQYLRKPHLGRALSAQSATDLQVRYARQPEMAVIVADGLSALAVHRHAAPLLREISAALSWMPDDERPLILVRNGRVAVGDHIGGIIEAQLSLVIIGERPGLSCPDSLGMYLTWNPRRGRNDAERNCISNIQPHGLSYELAAHKLAFLAGEARRRGLSGVALKENAAQLLR